MQPFRLGAPLETERLVLRPFAADDLDAVLAIRSRPEVMRFLYQEPYTAERVRELLEERAGQTALVADDDKLNLAVVLRSSGELVGEAGLFHLSVEHERGEIGFAFHPDHQGRGYATEAATELLRLGFEVLGLHRIVASCETRNTASAAVLERLGMRREAHFVENEWVKGEWQSELVYALLHREWEERS